MPNPNKRLETFDEFKAERQNRAKYKGLSNAEWKSRYETYASSRAGQGPSTSVRDLGRKDGRGGARHLPSGVSKASALSRETSVEQIARRQLARSDYFAAMANPFETGPGKTLPLARVPDEHIAPTVTFQSRFQVPIYSNSDGRAFFIVRPSLEHCFAVSNQTATSVPDGASPFDPPYDTAQVVWNAVNNGAASLGVGVAPWTANCWSINEIEGGQGTGLRPVPGADAKVSAYAAYRVTACGVRFEYTSPTWAHSGKVTTALVPGSVGMPYCKSPAYSLKTDLGSTNDTGRFVSRELSEYQMDPVGPTYENIFSLLTGAATNISETAVVDTIWQPMDHDAATAYRPTKYNPMSHATTMDQIVDAGTNPTFWLFPPSCSGDPDDFRSFYNMFYSANQAVQDLNGEGLFWSPNAGNELANGLAAQQTMRKFACTNMADGDNAIVGIIEGAQAQQGQPAGEIGFITIVINYEGLPEIRTLQESGSELTATLVGSKAQVNLALMAMEKIPRIRAYPNSAEAETGNAAVRHAEFVKSAATAISDATHTVGQTAKDVIGTVLDVGEVIASIFGFLA